MSSKEHERLIYSADIGHKAKVERDSASGPLIAECNDVLRNIGQVLQKSDPGCANLQYAGSAAVHIFLSPAGILAKDGTPQIGLFCQVSTLGQVPELISASALQDLLKSAAGHYGHKLTPKRSGF